MDDFTKRKERVLKGLVSEGASDDHVSDNEMKLNRSDSTSKRDKSLKGGIDTLLVPICDFINSHPDYVTTSCCSGRITAYQQAHTAAGKRVKSGGRLVFVSHDPVDPSGAEKLLMEILEGARHYPEKKSSKLRGEAEPTLSHTDLKLEPVILHVEAATEAAALALLRAAVSAGLRESGISALGKRNLVAIRGSQRMETPLTLGGRSFLSGSKVAQKDRDTHIAARRGEEALLVTPDYFSSLLFLCNEKLECNARQISRLYETFKEQLGPHKGPATEANECQAATGGSHPQPAGEGHCKNQSGSSDPAAERATAVACNNGNGSNLYGSQWKTPKPLPGTERGSDIFVGVQDKKQLKAVKSTLEALGVFDKTRKMQQIQLEGNGSNSLGITLKPPPDCLWLTLLPVKGAVSAASLPQHVRGSLMFDPEGSLQVFSFSLPPSARVIKKSVARCLDALLSAACESIPGGSTLLQEATRLRAQECSHDSSASPAAAGTAGNPAAYQPMVTWPEKFERMGDVILMPGGSLAEFERLKELGCNIVGAAKMSVIEDFVWRGFCKEFGAKAVGVQAPIEGRMRQSRARLVFGSSGLTTVRENGVLYTLDVTSLRFRDSLLQGKGPAETVVDLFCGIGYFSLSALAFVPAERLEKLYACDINPEAIKYFHMSLAKNHVDPKRVTFLLCDTFALPSGAIVSDASAVAAVVAESDAAAAARAALSNEGEQPEQQQERPKAASCIPAALVGVADRISLGLIPSSEEAWPTAVALVNSTRGGTLHIHGVAPLEAVKEEEKDVSSSVCVHPNSGSVDATARTDGCGSSRGEVRGNCKLGTRLQFAQHALMEVARLIKEKATKQGRTWEVSINHVEKVKSYAPKLFHFVVDITARPAL